MNRLSLLIVSIPVVLLCAACSMEPEPQPVQPQPTVEVSMAEPEPTPVPTPIPEPTALPEILESGDQVTAFADSPLETTGPEYLLLRRNMAIMKSYDIPSYSAQIQGREIGNWQGPVSRLVEADGETKVLIEMEPENERPRDDIVIHNLGNRITEQLQPGDTIAFSGAIRKIGEWEDARRMIHIHCTKIARVTP